MFAIAEQVKTGRYDDISLEQYHTMPGYSKTILDKVSRSMAHYLDYLANPPEQTDAFVLGSAIHCKILTPELFDSQFVKSPKFDRRKTKGKGDYAEFVLNNTGKTAIDEYEFDAIDMCCDAVKNHPVAGKLFENGKAENSFFWIDEYTGLLSKCRPDYLCDDLTIVELKTTKDASFESFQKDIGTYRYHVQSAYTFDGVSAVCGSPAKRFLIVAVETAPPYCVAVYDMVDCLTFGTTTYQADLDRIRKYNDEVVWCGSCWSGYIPEIQRMILPNWIKMKNIRIA